MENTETPLIVYFVLIYGIIDIALMFFALLGPVIRKVKAHPWASKDFKDMSREEFDQVQNEVENIIKESMYFPHHVWFFKNHMRNSLEKQYKKYSSKK